MLAHMNNSEFVGHHTSSTTANICPCRQQVEKKTVLENLDLALLAMDEIIDGG